MEKPEEIEEYQYYDAQIKQDERKIEAGDMEIKEHENTNTRPRAYNAGKGVERLEVNFGGKKYDTQFTSTEKKKTCFMHYMHKLAVDVTFAHMTAKKGIKKYGDRKWWSPCISNTHN